MNNWITFSDIEAYTRKNYDKDSQSELDRIALAVQQAFIDYTSRNFPDEATTDITEYFNCELSEIYPSQFPVSSVESLEYKTDWDGSYSAYANNYAIIDSRYIALEAKIGSDLAKSVKLVYRASVAPEDVKQCLIEWVLLIWNARTQAGQLAKSEQKGTKSVNYHQIDNLPANIMSVLNRYKVLYV